MAKPADAPAKQQKSIVQGIEATNGKMGDTTRRNSMTSRGRNTHVEICAGV